MHNPNGSAQDKIQAAEKLFRSGQDEEARRILMEILSEDETNLGAWEMLHKSAKNHTDKNFFLEKINALKKELSTDNSGHSFSHINTSPLQSSAPKIVSGKNLTFAKRRKTFLLIFLIFMLICLGLWAAVAYSNSRSKNQQNRFTATETKSLSCQTLIDRALEASNEFCEKIGANTVCYGNNTLKVELIAESPRDFVHPGDVIDINNLHKLSASPLDLTSEEWGIAIFKVLANLPRSLPGETIRMVVFGNTSLSSKGGLETFYFSSELGQLVCEEVPFDGLMITVPDGSGIRFSINGTDLVLMGTASLKATKGDRMEVSLYSGSGYISANGGEQYFGAGSMVSVGLGGVSGDVAIGQPSAPVALDNDALRVACALSADFCNSADISPLSPESARALINESMLLDPAISETATPESTSTQTPTVNPFATQTKTPTATSTPSPTASKTQTLVATATTIPTSTPDSPTAIPTSTPVPPTATTSSCSNISVGGMSWPGEDKNLTVSITNNYGTTILISSISISWTDIPSDQKLKNIKLGGTKIYTTDVQSPPAFISGGWSGSVADRSLNDGSSKTLLFEFEDNLHNGTGSTTITFTNGCSYSRSR